MQEPDLEQVEAVAVAVEQVRAVAAVAVAVQLQSQTRPVWRLRGNCWWRRCCLRQSRSCQLPRLVPAQVFPSTGLCQTRPHPSA